MILYYVRHGDPIYEPDQLTELGKIQASAVAKRLALRGVDRIYSSTSTRARQTAQPLCNLLKKEPELLDWCNEGYAWEELTIINEQGRSCHRRRRPSDHRASQGGIWRERIHLHPRGGCQ